ncbi:SRPBCC family protein [Actinoplanes sp. TBRC 11911]|uniref:SRPBCC family protein n=1 Tax=Actinoplanes sp. TBRC 11911 TaxID=2729386 RepID=UPI00145F0806|nr:SRPBCC family protein [Actinoplanes sp. TBRC 11911]NMO50421.1 SRPBCC family protein [Actinoplanes sp. TBRC 11911]
MTTSSGSAVVTLPADTQILVTREFDAPRRLVWRAYTEPELIKRWWAGLRGNVTSVEVDLRVGGRWRYVMQANGGFEVAFHGEYREIAAPERLVNTEAYEGIPEPDANAALVTMTLVEKEERTFMEVLIETRDKDGRDAIINSGMESGMQESYDALEQVAATLK